MPPTLNIEHVIAALQRARVEAATDPVARRRLFNMMQELGIVVQESAALMTELTLYFAPDLSDEQARRLVLSNASARGSA